LNDSRDNTEIFRNVWAKSPLAEWFEAGWFLGLDDLDLENMGDDEFSLLIAKLRLHLAEVYINYLKIVGVEVLGMEGGPEASGFWGGIMAQTQVDYLIKRGADVGLSLPEEGDS